MEAEKKNSILVVDDESANVETLKQILKPEYTVYSANSGKSAIETAEEYLPDLILLDILMPDMDGYAVIDALKKSTITRSIPVIFITGLSGDDDEERGLNSGAADYITKPFSLANVRLRVKNQINTLVQLRSVEQLSMVDQLTSLPNRRSFEQTLKSEWARAFRDKTPISILFIDADKFKNYNDTYGHPQGDVLLQEISRVFVESLKRPGDYIARWGGEEFVALLANTDLSGALDVAEDIRRNVENLDILCQDGEVTKITVSIGVNTLPHGHGSSIEDFVSAADTALYDAKGKGRNRVSHA